MKVIVLNDFAWINGGASKVALLSARGLSSRGVPVRVFAGSGEPDQETLDAGIPIESLRQQPYNQLGVRQGWKQSFWNSKAADELTKLLGDESPAETVLHIHSCRDVLSASVVQVAQRLGFKLVYTHHDYGGACPYGGFFNYKTGHPCGKYALSSGCIGARCNLTGYGKKLFTVQKARRERRLGYPSAVAAHVFVSEFSREIISGYLSSNAVQQVIRNPMEITRTEPASLNGPFVFVGRLTLEKDPLTFAAAARKAGVDSVFIGDGPQADAIVSTNPDAQLLGWQSPATVEERLRSAAGLVFPSAWYETQGLVVGEAMALGLPVIASDVCAAREAVEKSGGGLLFRAHDVAALARHLESLQSLDYRTVLGRKAYDWFWSDPPTMDKHVGALLAMYEQVLDT